MIPATTPSLKFQWQQGGCFCDEERKAMAMTRIEQDEEGEIEIGIGIESERVREGR